MRRYCKICGQAIAMRPKGAARKSCDDVCAAIAKQQYHRENVAKYPSQSKAAHKEYHKRYYPINREKILAQKKAALADPVKRQKLKEYQARTRAKQRAAMIACRELGLI